MVLHGTVRSSGGLILPLNPSCNSSWISDMVAVLQADELPQDIPGAEALLSGHSEHRAEIYAREAGVASFRKKGEALVAASHYASHEVPPLS